MFLCLVMAHLVADFVLQTNKICKDKAVKRWRSMYHYGHALVVIGLSWLVTWNVYFWWFALFIGVAHFTIDICKSYRDSKIVWFVLDQFIHLLVIAGVAYAWTSCHDWACCLVLSCGMSQQLSQCLFAGNRQISLSN